MRLQMVRHPADVGSDIIGAGKNTLVNTLEDIAPAITLIGQAISRVDQAGGQGLYSAISGGEAEAGENGLQIPGTGHIMAG